MHPITLTLDLVNAILAQLGELPSKQVFAVVAEIHRQATPQLPVEAPAEEAAPE